MVFAGGRCAVGQRPPAVVKAHVALATEAVRAGSSAQVSIIAEVEPGYHINDHHPSLSYLIPTVVQFAPARGFQVEKIVYPQGKVQKFVFAEKGLSVYEGQVAIRAVFKVAPTVESGNHNLHGNFEYQACNDHACLPPESVPLTLKLKVVSRSAPLRHVDSYVPGKSE
ncbi:MAG TPA: protein-disulfide reductase DsbD domain-containing protein [Terriglobia bacterium]|nr:protein-disulfide reductase DsbD domain-containing protein [Terriglobia bacterium]